MTTPQRPRHYNNNVATASMVSWLNSEAHHTVYRNHARKVVRAWKREYRVFDRAFLPGRWQPGYWSGEHERDAA